MISVRCSCSLEVPLLFGLKQLRADKADACSRKYFMCTFQTVADVERKNNVVGVPSRETTAYDICNLV
jgi:hypothetical protein